MEFGKYDVERVNEIDFQNNDLALYIMVVMVAHCEPWSVEATPLH